MPFKIVQEKDGKYKLFNIHKKKYAKPKFNTKESATSAGKNFIKYRERKDSKVVGNRILPIK